MKPEAAGPEPGRPKAGPIPSGDRKTCSTNEGRAFDAAGPTPGRPKAGPIPSGDRSAYSTNVGRT